MIIFEYFRQTFYTQSKLERQHILLNSYGFVCDCIACENNFPVFDRLRSFDKATLKAAKRGKDELIYMNGIQAKKRFNEYCRIIQIRHGKAFPSADIVLLQECLLQCLSIAIKPSIVIT